MWSNFWKCENGKKRKLRLRIKPTNLSVIGRLLDDLRGHPKGCAHKCLSFVGRVSQLTGNTKISQFHISMLRQQHVGRWNQHQNQSVPHYHDLTTWHQICFTLPWSDPTTLAAGTNTRTSQCHITMIWQHNTKYVLHYHDLTPPHWPLEQTPKSVSFILRWSNKTQAT